MVQCWGGTGNGDLHLEEGFPKSWGWMRDGDVLRAALLYILHGDPPYPCGLRTLDVAFAEFQSTAELTGVTKSYTVGTGRQ